VPPATSEIAEALGALRETFESLGLRWYVFGAQAAILYGSSRMTEDVDVTVELGAVGVPEIVAALASRGFSSRVEDMEALALTARVLPIEHDASRTPVDVILAGPGLEEDLLARAQIRAIGTQRVPVITAEDLVALKLLAHRPHDVEDAVAVLRAQRGRFDATRTKQVLADLAEVLEDPDLVSRFDAVIRRAR
jgi:hypothetical protein